MPWPAIAAIAGKVLGGLAASGAGAGAAGAAGAGGAGASGIGGMLGGGGGGMMGGKGIMGMMGGQGGGGGQAGGMMQNIAGKIGSTGAAVQGGLVNMLEAQDGLLIDPKLFDYLSKMQGTEGQAPAMGNPPVADNTAMASGLEAQTPQVQGQDVPDAAGSAPPVNPMTQVPDPNQQVADPARQPAQQQTITPGNPSDLKTNLPGANQGPPGKGAAGQISSLMGMMGKGNYTTDQRGVTQVSETSDVLGNSVKKFDPKKPGSAITATAAFVTGIAKQQSEQRRARREEAQLASDFSRAQQASSVYADPNSVYYSAKDGAPVSLSKMMVGGRTKNC
jgi:hypothetical protein